MPQYAVFGHPIHHSQSPFIHQQFAKQCGISLRYDAILAPVDGFRAALVTFYQNGGRGANVTTPFKEQAYAYCNTLTARATKAGAVNTLLWSDAGDVLGDNTDGIGLVTDLQRQGMIKAQTTVLIVGAGGAARGIILPLLELNSHITITNRSFNRAETLADDFSRYGHIHAIKTPNDKFDLIINATSSGIQGEVPLLSERVASEHTACYDLFYQQTATPFIRWAKMQGCTRYSDGLGMLVAQAAHAFSLWHGVMPEIQPVLNQLRAALQAKV